jgi:hypothetical protein
MIYRSLDAALPGTMGTAVERPVRLDSVSHDLAAAVFAYGSQPVNGTFEAVKGMRLAGSDYLEGEIVVVATDFTSSHRALLETGSTVLPTPEDWQGGLPFASGPSGRHPL